MSSAGTIILAVALWLVGLWAWDWYYNRRHRNRNK